MAVTTRQRALIATLATIPFPTIAAAAEACGIPLDTANKWQRNPEFRTALDTAMCEIEEGAKRLTDERIRALVPAAVVAIAGNLTDPSGNVREQAGEYILNRVAGKPRDRHELSGPDGGAVPFDLSGFSDDQLRAIVARATPAHADGNPSA